MALFNLNEARENYDLARVRLDRARQDGNGLDIELAQVELATCGQELSEAGQVAACMQGGHGDPGVVGPVAVVSVAVAVVLAVAAWARGEACYRVDDSQARPLVSLVTPKRVTPVFTVAPGEGVPVGGQWVALARVGGELVVSESRDDARALPVHKGNRVRLVYACADEGSRGAQ